MNKYYLILGISPDASLDEVRDAYRDLVKVWHPDRFSHDPKLRAKAEGKLKSINEAYEKILSDLNCKQATHAISPRWTTSGSVEPSRSETTTKIVQHSRRRTWYLGLIIIGLSLVAVMVITQRIRRGDSQYSAASTASPVHEASPPPTSTPTPPPPSPIAQPSRDELDDLLDSIEPEKEPEKKSSPPPLDLSAGVVESDSTPPPMSTPTPHRPPRTESLVSAYDVLSVGVRKDEDSRRYRFRLQERARVKGSFSAHGNIRVEILGGYYSSGGPISADSIDLVMDPGIYELMVSARETVGFNVRLTAYYEQ